MKYKETRKHFLLAVKGSKTILIVKPFNGETRRNPSWTKQVSWSHGYTHYEIVDVMRPWDYDEAIIHRPGEIGFCGQNWFEQQAVTLPKYVKSV